MLLIMKVIDDKTVRHVARKVEERNTSGLWGENLNEGEHFIKLGINGSTILN